MEICLHIGAHRTATTSFQQFLQNNRKTLDNDRIGFWGPGRTRSGMFAGLVRNPDYLDFESARLAKRSIGRIHIELARAAEAGMKRLIVTEENMIGTMHENLTTQRLYGQAQARLNRFAPGFGGHPLRIGVAIRSYDMYWASVLAFRIRRGIALPTQDDLDRLVTQPRRWRHVITEVASVFPEAEIAVWPFEAWASQPDHVLEALTGRLAPKGLHVADDPCNASLTAQQIGEIAAERGQTAIAAQLNNREGRYMPFAPHHIAKLREDYAADIDWLKQSTATGLAAYFDPFTDQAGDTSGRPQDARGRRHDQKDRRRERRLDRAS